MKFYKKYMLFFLLLAACNNNTDEISNQENSDKKIGVLFVSHGSRSEAWRKMLLAIEDSVKTDILSNKSISGLKSAFMEYNEPSIATRLKEFDNENYTDVIIVPIFLTVSAHSFDDIPTIAGLKRSSSEIEKLKHERIEVYNAKANIHITPLLDYTDILGKNLVTRIKKLSVNPTNEGAVLIAYGDQEYDKEWTELMKTMMNKIEAEVGINKFEYTWCGHIVHYDTKPTTTAIENILKEKDNCIVMPVLVAFDEMFQGDVIGGGIDNVKNKEKVIYKPDAILPDKNVENWVINITNKFVSNIINSTNQ
jgi:hypothetical protein